MAELKIGVVGAGGRMGCAVVREVAGTDGCVLTAACDADGHPAIGKDAGDHAGLETAGVSIGSDAKAVFEASEVVIEFTLPDATVGHLPLSGETGTPHVIGTTGMTADQEAAIAEAGKSAPVLHAPNMSLAVNLLFGLTRQVAGILDDSFDIEIVEMHHKHKVDAPSGTAVGLGRAAAAGRKVDLDEVGVWARHGQTGERKRGDIGFATLRGGDVAGEHSVIFAVEGERLELSHKASTRQIFARGAVFAAKWIADKPIGFYSMFDALGIEG